MIRALVLTITFSILAANHASAWNSVGHMTVAKIAYDELDAKSKSALYKLLKQHPHYKDYLSASKPADIDNDVQWVIVRSAVWPDWVRGSKKDSLGLDINRFNRGEEHYVNIPFIDPKDEKFFAGKTLIDPDLPNILTALKQRANDLKTKTASPEDRAVAACWLFHLVGDIHQPLHNVAYFERSGFQKGDLGGNIRYQRMAANGLHQFWDDVPRVRLQHDSAKHQAISVRGLNLSAASLTDADTEAGEEHDFGSWSRELRTGRWSAIRSDGGLLKRCRSHSRRRFPMRRGRWQGICLRRATAENR